MAPPPYLLRAAVNKFPCNDTKNTAHLTFTPPRISLLSKMYIVLTKKVGRVDQMVGTSKLKLDERNIEGG